MKRVLAVTQVLLTSGYLTLVWPVAIMLSSFVLNVLLFASIGDQIRGQYVTYGVVSIYIVQLIVASQGIIQTFSFMVGLNVSRRAFYLGDGLALLLQSLSYGVLLYAGALIEHATNGWGGGLRYFDPLPVTHGDSPLLILVYAVPLVLVSYLGMVLGLVAKRWGSNGILAISLGTLLVGGGAAVLVTWARDWLAVGDWFADQSGLSLAIGWTLPVVTVLAAIGYRLIRRATP
jgi:hypothetical protein